MKEKKVSMLGLIVLVVITAFSMVVCVGIFNVLGPNVGLIAIFGILFMIAWMCGMVIPDDVFMKLVLILSGLGFMGTTMMSALFPGKVMQSVMFILMVLAMGQLILRPLEDPPDS